MRIGISTACFYPELTEKAIERMSALGLGVCEIFVNCQDEFDTFLPVFQQKLYEGQMECVSIHPFTSGSELMIFFSGYERRISESLAVYGKYFEFLKSLGGRYFTFHGARCSGRERLPAADEIEIYKRLVDLADSKGVCLAQENVYWCRSFFPDYIAELHAKVEGLGFTLDIKQAKRAGRPVRDYLDAMGEGLVNIHISDADETSTCLLPGQGGFDFENLFGELSRRGYKGDALIEVYSECFSDDGQIALAGDFVQRLVK